jgi:hypothetical protein
MAHKSLTRIAAILAETPAGLSAKARVAAIMLENNEGDLFETADLELLRSLAAETKYFLQPICDGRVTLQPAASPAP